MYIKFVPNDIKRNLNIVPIQRQFLILKKYFDILRDLKIENSLSETPLPERADAFFVSANMSILSETYEDALKLVFQALANVRKFRNELNLSIHHLRREGYSEAMIEMVSEEQDDSPVIVYPAQLGEYYYGLTPGKTFRRLRNNKFGMSTLSVAQILLTHPEILSSQKELAICCVGDEYNPTGAPYQFDSAPVFYLDKDTVVLGYINKGTNWNDSVSCASAYFIPYN